MKNAASERKKFELEHPNNFDTESDLTCHNVKIKPSALGQFKELIEPNSLGQCDEPSPTQTVADKDILISFIDEVFPKSLLLQLTQQVAEILKNDSRKEAESKSPRSINSPRKEDKDDWLIYSL